MILTNGFEEIATEIWHLLTTYPDHAVGIFLIFFIGLVLFFKFIIRRVTPYIIIVCAGIAFVLTPLVLLALARADIITAVVVSIPLFVKIIHSI